MSLFFYCDLSDLIAPSERNFKSKSRERRGNAERSFSTKKSKDSPFGL